MSTKNQDIHGSEVTSDAHFQQKIVELEAQLARQEKELVRLRTSEEQFRFSMENMLDACGIYQSIRNDAGEIVDFRIVYVNEAACRNNRMTRDEQVGRTLLEILPAHQASGLLAHYSAVVETGVPSVLYGIPYADDYKDEALKRYFDIQVVKSGDGFLASWRDVSEQTRTLHELENSRERLRLALEAAELGFWQWDGKDLIVLSRRLCTWLGLPCQREFAVVDSTEVSRCIHPEDLESARNLLNDALTEQTDFHHEMRFLLEGKVQWIELIGRAVHNESTEAPNLIGVALDITERKQAQGRLHEALSQSTSLLDSVHMGLAILDSDMKFIYVNQFMADLNGVPVEAHHGNRLSEFLPEVQNIQQLEAIGLHVMATGVPALNIEGYGKTKASSSEQVWRAHYFPVELADSSIGLGIAAENITEFKQASEKQDHERELLQKLYEQLPIMLTIYDPEFKVFHFNQAFSETFGWSLEDATGMDLIERLCPDPIERRQALSYMKQADGTWQECKVYAKDGQPVPSQWCNIRVSEHTYVGVGIDLRNLKHTEEELENALALLDALFDSAPLGLGFWDQELRFTRINQALAAMNGLPPEEHIGRTPSELLPDLVDIHEIEELWRSVLQSGQPLLNFEVKGRTFATDQEHVWREHFFPVRQGGSIVGLGAMVEDITQWKQVQEERKVLVQQLESERAKLLALSEGLEERVVQRTQEVRQLVEQLSVVQQEEREQMAQVLHDHVQQLLYGIQFRISFIESEISSDSEARVHENIEDVKELVLATIRATRSLGYELSPPVLVHSDLGSLLRWLADSMHDLHRLESSVRMEKEIHLVSRSTRILLLEVIRELMFNVVKHTDCTSIELIAALDAGMLHITVRDYGQGLDPSLLSNTKADQLGLGLTSIRRRLRLIKGDLQIASVPGEGTDVTVVLPVD